MEVLRTLKEVFAHNLRKYRGNKTQAQVSDAAGIPFRTYQDMEAGIIPRKEWGHVESLARHYGIQETALFFDAELVDSTISPTAEDLLAIIKKRDLEIAALREERDSIRRDSHTYRTMMGDINKAHSLGTQDEGSKRELLSLLSALNDDEARFWLLSIRKSLRANSLPQSPQKTRVNRK